MNPFAVLTVIAALTVLGACAETGGQEKSLPASEPPPAATGVPSPRDIPAQPGWSNPDVALSEHQRDIEACYDYAWSQVERDLRIESDIQDTMDTMASGLGFSPEERQADLYGAQQRRYRLFEQCMRSKGYQPEL